MNDIENNSTNSNDINQFNEDFSFKNVFSLIIRRRKIIVFSTLFLFSLGIINISYQRIFNPKFSGAFTLMISDPMDNKKPGGGLAAQSSEIFANIAKNSTEVDSATLIEYLKSDVILEDLEKKYNLKPLTLGTKRLKIKVGGETEKRRIDRAEGILHIKLLIDKPKEDLLLLKDIKNKYLEASKELRQKRLNDGLEFLNEQEPILQAKKENLQFEIVKFREKYNLISPQKQGLINKERQRALEEEISILETKSYRLSKIKERILEGKITARGFQEAVGLENFQGLEISETDNSYLDQLLILEEELAAAKTKYRKDSQTVINLKKRQEEIRPIFLNNQFEAVDLALDFNKNSLKSLKEQKSTLISDFTTKPKLIKEYNSINSKLLIATKNLDSLISARETFQLEIAQNSVPWLVIKEPFISQKLVSPNLKKDFFTTLFLSIFLGMIVGFIRDRLNYVYRNPKEVSDSLKKPILGSLPYLECLESNQENFSEINFLDLEKSFINFDKNESKKFKQEFFILQESLRNLFTSIKFLNTEDSQKLLAITSSVPSEGKSIVSILYAKTLISFGKKVLLIDADMRKPQIHKRTKMDNIRGLSNFLIGKENDLKGFIQTHKDFKNLDILTAGLTPPDTTRLLSSQKMQETLSYLKNESKYDVILIDNPPFLGLADCSLISRKVDGVLLVVGLDEVKRNLPQETLNRILSMNSNFLGIITNSLKKRDNLSNQYSYGYGPDEKNSYFKYFDDSESDLDSEEFTQIEKNFFKKTYNKFIEIGKNIINWIEN